MQNENTYYFTNRSTMLTLCHDIGEQIKGIRITFTNADGETVEYEDTKTVGEKIEAVSNARRALNMTYNGLEIGDKRYNVLIDGLVDSQLDTVNVTATVQQIGEAGPVELEDPEYTVTLMF